MGLKEATKLELSLAELVASKPLFASEDISENLGRRLMSRLKQSSIVFERESIISEGGLSWLPLRTNLTTC